MTVVAKEKWTSDCSYKFYFAISFSTLYDADSASCHCRNITMTQGLLKLVHICTHFFFQLIPVVNRPPSH
jgi:hypothetical protein